MLKSLFNKVAGLRPPSYVLTLFFSASAESLPHIVSYYSAPIFQEDLPVNASIFLTLI